MEVDFEWKCKTELFDKQPGEIKGCHQFCTAEGIFSQGCNSRLIIDPLRWHG